MLPGTGLRLTAILLTGLLMSTLAALATDDPACRVHPPARSAFSEEFVAGQVRAAFVVGNSNYSTIQPLANPVNDADAVTGALTEIGFNVYASKDASDMSLMKCFEAFEAAFDRIDVSIFYYAGHAVQVSDTNYILGTNAKSGVPDTAGVVRISDLVERVQERSSATLVFLDACRTSPFGEQLPAGLSASTGRSAVPVVVDKPLSDNRSQAQGVFVAYSTSPNAVALDGTESLSPFAAAFVEEIRKPGVSIQEMMANVNARVGEATAWTQTPWSRSSLGVALRMKGDLTLLDAVAASEIWATRSRAHHVRGARKEAVLDALKGIPLEQDAHTQEVFRSAWHALENALRSGAVRIDAPDDTEYAWISPDRRRVVTVGVGNASDGIKIDLWDAESGARITELASVSGKDALMYLVFSPHFSGDGGRLGISLGNGVVGVWRTSDGKLVNNLEFAIQYGSGFASIDLDETGKRLILSSDSDQRSSLIEVETGKILATIGHGAGGAAIDVGGSYGVFSEVAFDRTTDDHLAFSLRCACDRDSKVFGLLDLRTLEVFGHESADGSYETYHLISFADRKRIAIFSPNNRTRATELSIVNVASGESILNLEVPEDVEFTVNYDLGIVAFLRNQWTFINVEDGSAVDGITHFDTESFVPSAHVFTKDGRKLSTEPWFYYLDDVWKPVLRGKKLIDAASSNLSERDEQELAAERIRYWGMQ